LRDFARHTVYCNGIKPKERTNGEKYLILEHDETAEDRNVCIKLNNFVSSVYKLDNRLKDLLEIAGYIYAADRKTYRGNEDDLEYHSWSRDFHFHIGVRDVNFWETADVKRLLKNALCFMSGDHNYDFTFYETGIDYPTNIFDNENFIIETPDNLQVALFSGGIDSLAGIIDLLETTNAEICLVSHQSGQPGVIKTQRDLCDAIKNYYPNRCSHYKFCCNFSKDNARDETQRTRSFLYTSIAFAIAKTYNQKCIHVYENGITSINFAETQDLMNGRSSRTTHPQTIRLLEKLFSKIAGDEFSIKNPFVLKTKTEVIEVIKKHNRLELLDSSVSCSTTRNHPQGFTHCGICSQCIDRKFAVFAAEVEEYDGNHLYHYDFLQNDLEDDETKKSLTEYIRLAQEFAQQNIDGFYTERGSEIVDVVEYIDGETDQEKIENVYNLCQRHAAQITKAITRMRNLYDSPLTPYKPKSFFNLIIRPREYQKGDEKPDKAIVEENEIPSKGLKRLVKEACESFVENGTIIEVINETKKNRRLSELIVKKLKKDRYKITKKNENTISDYLRKYEVRIKKEKNGKLVVVESRRRR